MVVGFDIVFPRTADQIEEAYFRYLQSIAHLDTELAPTRANAKRFTETILWPARERREPILFAVQDGKIIGATFTTLPSEGFEYRWPFATGHGTWVEDSHRRQGVAEALIEAVRKMLRAKGVTRQIGLCHSANKPSKSAFRKMGFREHGAVLICEL